MIDLALSNAVRHIVLMAVQVASITLLLNQRSLTKQNRILLWALIAYITGDILSFLTPVVAPFLSWTAPDIISTQIFFGWFYIVSAALILSFVYAVTPPDTVRVIKNLLFTFEGRISRKQFWINGTLPVLFTLTLPSIGLTLMPQAGPQVLGYLLCLPLSWISLALLIKRLHDLDKSGWFSAIGIIPIIGTAIVAYFAWFQKGTAGPNRFGDDPLNNKTTLPN